MERNRLGGALGDKLNAMLSALGFNLVKLMKSLKLKFCIIDYLCCPKIFGFTPVITPVALHQTTPFPLRICKPPTMRRIADWLVASNSHHLMRILVP